MAKALHVRSPNPAGCDKIAHESKPLRSAAAADAVHLAIDRPVFFFDSGIAVCLRTGDICASRRQARGTGRDAGLRCRRSWCRAAAMQASWKCRRPLGSLTELFGPPTLAGPEGHAAPPRRARQTDIAKEKGRQRRP